MTLDEYQEAARETALWREREFGIPPLDYCVLGLASEAGEVAGKVKKLYRDKGGVLTEQDRMALLKELGGSLWYIAMIADCLDAPLSQVGKLNVGQLADRKERGTLGGSGDDR